MGLTKKRGLPDSFDFDATMLELYGVLQGLPAITTLEILTEAKKMASKSRIGICEICGEQFVLAYNRKVQKRCGKNCNDVAHNRRLRDKRKMEECQLQNRIKELELALQADVVST